MNARKFLYILLILALAIVPMSVMAQDDDDVRVIADFETDELFLSH